MEDRHYYGLPALVHLTPFRNQILGRLNEFKSALLICSGSSDAVLALTNAGASVQAHDKDGLTGKYNNAQVVNRAHFSICY